MDLRAPAPVPSGHLSALRAAEALGPSSADDALAHSSALRSAGHSPEETAWALSQRAFRASAAPRLGARAASMLFTRAGLEQASRAELAARHARLVVEAGARRVVDAGCGLGTDSLAFLDAGLEVVAVEIDPETASLTAWNLAQHPRGGSARVVVGDVVALMEAGAFEDEWADWSVWFDPARREGGPQGRRRRFDPEAFSPPLSRIARLAERSSGRVIAAKLGPALDAADAPQGFDVDWTTHRRETSEALILGPRESPRLRAVVISESGEDVRERPRATETAEPPATAPSIEPGDVLWEPAGSVMRAGLVEDLAVELDADLLAPEIAYLLSPAAAWPGTARHPFAAAYRVREVLPLHTKRLKAWVARNAVTELTIKKRGIDADPAQWRKTLLAGSKPGRKPRRPATIVLTRHGENRVAVVVEPEA
ncbi:class I SAM-dependent methyltransferase [Falsarthrobacter nasiphocae]